MFELPNAKRVRREDLHASDDSDENYGEGSAEHASALAARLNAQIAKALGLDDEADGTTHSANGSAAQAHDESQEYLDAKHPGFQRDETQGVDEQEEGYEFNLFSTGVGTLPKVILEDDKEFQGEGVFVRPRRPRSSYAATAISAIQRDQYAFAALTGDQVLQRSQRRSWGMEQPWRVARIRTTQITSKPRAIHGMIWGEVDTSNRDGERRCRPGKRSRIMLRKRKKVEEQKNEEAAKKLLEKGEHLKDKKKRLNRLKKLRRRAKDKENKQSRANVNDEGDDDSET